MPTSAGMNKIRNFIKSLMSYGRYRIGSTFYTVPIHEVKVEDEKVLVYLLIDHNATGTIDMFQLFDKEGEMFEEKPDSIAKTDTQGVLVRFTFLIQEVS